MTTVEFPLKPNQPPVRFKFTIPNTRSLELAAGVGIDLLRLRGQSVHALVLMTCYGLKWADKKMTEDRAAELIQVYMEAGGSIEPLSKAVVQALNESGVYGDPETPDAEGDGPLTETTQETPTT